LADTLPQPQVTGDLANALEILKPDDDVLKIMKKEQSAPKYPNTTAVPFKHTADQIFTKDFNGTIKMPPISANQPAYLGVLSLLSDDGCTVKVGDDSWLTESGQGHDISKGYREYTKKILMPGKTYNITLGSCLD
jgi:hypothetical protein